MGGRAHLDEFVNSRNGAFTCRHSQRNSSRRHFGGPMEPGFLEAPRRWRMLVRDVMTRDVETIRPDESLADAASTMRDIDAGVLPVADGNKLLGMLTDRDITVRSTAKGADPRHAKVRDAMSAAVISCFEDQEVQEAATIM